MTENKSRACFRLSLSVEVEISGTEFFDPPDPQFWKELDKAIAEPMSEEKVLDQLEYAQRFSNDDWGKHIDIKEVNVVEDYNPEFDKSWHSSKLFTYLKKNLAGEIEAVVKQILIKEALILDAYKNADDIGATFKKLVLKNILNETEKRIKKRLPKRVGRPQARLGFNFIKDKIAFAERCFGAMEQLELAGKKLNQRNLAEHLYPISDPKKSVNNPEKALRNQLKKYGIRFAELMGSHTGRGPGVSTVEDMEARIDRYLANRNLEEI